MALPVVKGSRYTTILPSTGAEIEYRPYNVGEEKLLMVALESKEQAMIIRTLKDVMEGCIFDKVDFSKFTVFDFEKLYVLTMSFYIEIMCLKQLVVGLRVNFVFS